MQPAVLLFSSDLDDPEHWRRIFARHRPDIGFRVWPQPGDRSAITHALVWKIPGGALAQMPNLRAVFALGAGVDQILSDPDFPRHVPLFRLVDAGLREQMTEYALYGVLHWHRRMREYAALSAAGKWQRLEAVHPSQRTIAVMGLGVFGADLARKLCAMGFQVSGWSRTRKVIEGVECYAGNPDLPAFLARAEVLVNLLPLTDATRGILSAQLFAQLPGNGALIHLGRGGHLVESDLIDALDTNRLDWAMLDVFPVEPLPSGSPLWAHPRVLVTPHIAAQTIGDSAEEQILGNFLKFERGEQPAGRVDLSIGY
jgi:glyoxylate/hydroxypyruvate reductase